LARRTRVGTRLLAAGAAAGLVLGVAACGDNGGDDASKGERVTVGLITKRDTNPFFVKMKEAAQAAAKANNVELLTAAGKTDTDNQSQVTAIENMTTRGAKGILITPADSKAIVPAVQKSRAAGVIVIALDTPTEPQSAVDALFATDNKKAGVLIGRWAKEKFDEEKKKPLTSERPEHVHRRGIVIQGSRFAVRSSRIANWQLTKQNVAAIRRRERMSERWQALGVGPQRKVRNADRILTNTANTSAAPA